MEYPSIDLSGKTALVTGASRGIGLAISRALAMSGANVIGIGTSISKQGVSLDAGCADLEERFRPMVCDLSDRAAIEAMIAGLDRDGVSVDILVNNAGMIRRTEAANHAMADWDAVMAVNLDAVFLLCREFGRRMVRRGSGKIVNIASLLSFQGGVMVPGYAASKGAVAQLTRAFANEWASQGVNVNAVAPGYVATDLTTDLRNDGERSHELMTRTPAQRWGRPEDIAWPVAFLASPMADFIHGAILPVDGGWMGR